MKILFSAFTANPYAGSEAQCGWSWAYAMRNYNEVYLLTRNEHKKAVENYIKQNNITNIKVFYHDIPEWMNLYNKTHKNFFYFCYYYLWQKTVLKTVKKLNDKYHFDYIQHVTLGDFRIAAPLWKTNTKFIFGPVGGAQTTPDVFMPYIKGHEKSEKIREIINSLAKLNPCYKRTLNKASLILCANKETQAYLCDIIKDKSKCRLLTENGIISSKINEPIFNKKNENDTVNILWAGRFLYRKGLQFLLEALRLVETDRKFRLLLVGDGSESNNLKRLSEELKIDDKVTFLGQIQYTEMKEVYLISDFFVFPSLRETTGTVLFEAMSNGLPVLTFNQNGADLLIDENCGIKVNINQNLDNIKNDFAKGIKTLIENDELRYSLGKAAYTKILNEYTWESKCKTFESKFLKDIQ
ncbi:MAG: glycosyltransferase family 4 protein [Eubacterium sp.]|nr:glycosyltransferase family 4 protein [Eubacterium sp.]